MNSKEIAQLSSLVKTMRQLRSPDGCAWDREQTAESLCPFILEEAYELIDAIDSGDTGEILAELGDLLLQVIFQAQIFTERGVFGIGDIAEGIDLKLKRRHPHIFAPSEGVSQYPDWEQIKQKELKAKGRATDFASRQPVNLPALKLADKYCRHLSKRSSSVPLNADHQELNSTVNQEMTEASLADEMFKLVRHAHKLGIDSDSALRKYILNCINNGD